ncbi:hypothetical protein ACWEV4_28790 [Streptomyces sp. NPDC003860]
MTRSSARPTAGIIDDIEGEDDEPEDAVRADVVLWVVVNPAILPAGWEVAA